MIKTLTRKKVSLAALVLLIGLLGCGITLLIAPGLIGPQAGPETRWAARSFDHYRLVYTVSGLVTCTVTAEVRAEEVVSSQTTPDGGEFCAIMSVSGLFRRIDTLLKDVRCGPNGCGCDGPLEAVVTYDPVLGYPTLINQKLHPEDRWRYFDYWVHNSIGGGCTLVGYIGTRIEVTGLAPLK